jgi:hypothetical protein
MNFWIKKGKDYKKSGLIAFLTVSIFNKTLNKKEIMDNNHAAFIAIYQNTRTQKAKKQLLKTYMLSLSSKELDSFIFGTLDKLELLIKTDMDKNSLSDSDKQTIIADLEVMANSLESKRLKAA